MSEIETPENSEEHREDIRVLPAVGLRDRVETGAIRFGDDWPGVFIRGDRAGYYAMMLDRVINGSASELDIFQLRSLRSTLSGCVIGPASRIIEPPRGETNSPDALKALCDLLDESGLKMVFWVCPNGCRGRVRWNEDKTDATCGVCDARKSDNA